MTCMRRKFSGLFLVLAMCFAVNGNTLVTLGGHHFPPYMVFNELDGSCSGEAVDVSRIILRESNIDLQLVCASPARIFRLLKLGEVDFTINIKSTGALSDGVEFVDPPYTSLQLMLYENTRIEPGSKLRNIAAIRGFDYNGFRTRLLQQGYHFIDMPESISAVKMYLLGRSEGLITYQAPFIYYLQSQQQMPPNNSSSTLLHAVDSHYVISNKSILRYELKLAFEQYANKNKLAYFEHSLSQSHK